MRKGNRGSGHAQVQCGLLWSRHAPGTGHAPSRRKLLKGITTTAKDDSASIDLVSPVDGKRKAEDHDDSLLPPSDKQADAPTDSAEVFRSSAYMTGFDKFVHGLSLPMDDEVLRQRKLRKARVQKLADMIEGAKQATAHPPSAELPSGILAFHIHSITVSKCRRHNDRSAHQRGCRPSRGTDLRQQTRSSRGRRSKQASVVVRTGVPQRRGHLPH